MKGGRGPLTLKQALAEVERIQTKSSVAFKSLSSPSACPPPPPTPTPRATPKLASPSFYGTTASTISHSRRFLPITTTGLSRIAANALSAASVDHLCKSIVLVNTQAQSNVTDCRDRNNSKYYVVLVQYTARFSAETVKTFCIHSMMAREQKRNSTLLILAINAVRLAPEETSVKLTGYEQNAVTSIGMKTDIPVILDEAIVKLNPDFFWLSGGEVNLKLGIRISDFIEFVKPFIVSCSGN